MSTPPKFLPTLTEIVTVEPGPAVPDGGALVPTAQDGGGETARVLSEPEVAQLEQQLAHSHWLEQHLSPALRAWVETEVARQVAAQFDRLAPEWARALSEAVTAQVVTRVPAVVDRLVDDKSLPPPPPRF
jgi:hypothetical protein